MSSITFQSVSSEAQIGGRERAYSSGLIKRIYEGLLDLDGLLKYTLSKRNQFLALGRVLDLPISYDERYHSKMFLERASYKLSPIISPDSLVDLNGWKFNSWHAELNTAIKYGSDEVAFLVRLHAQCELHGYVAEEDRKWLATLIESGLSKKILREESQGYGKGWRDVVTLLRNNDGGPVVTNYSVCDSFIETASYHLGRKNVKWEKAVEWLTSQEDGGPKWSQENLRLLFGDGETVDEVKENLINAVKKESLPICDTCSGYGSNYRTHEAICRVCNGTGEKK